MRKQGFTVFSLRRGLKRVRRSAPVQIEAEFENENGEVEKRHFTVFNGRFVRGECILFANEAGEGHEAEDQPGTENVVVDDDGAFRFDVKAELIEMNIEQALTFGIDAEDEVDWLTIDDEGVLSGVPPETDAAVEIEVEVMVVGEDDSTETVPIAIFISEGGVVENVTVLDTEEDDSGSDGGSDGGEGVGDSGPLDPLAQE